MDTKTNTSQPTSANETCYYLRIRNTNSSGVSETTCHDTLRGVLRQLQSWRPSHVLHAEYASEPGGNIDHGTLLEVRKRLEAQLVPEV